MTNDIVERLRKGTPVKIRSTGETCYQTNTEMIEASDEIERLRAELAKRDECIDEMPVIDIQFQSKSGMETWISWRNKHIDLLDPTSPTEKG